MNKRSCHTEGELFIIHDQPNSFQKIQPRQTLLDPKKTGLEPINPKAIYNYTPESLIEFKYHLKTPCRFPSALTSQFSHSKVSRFQFHHLMLSFTDINTYNSKIFKQTTQINFGQTGIKNLHKPPKFQLEGIETSQKLPQFWPERNRNFRTVSLCRFSSKTHIRMR